MKDYVFIGWSQNREIAIKLKKILDRSGFVCVIGGIYEDNPEKLRSRLETVNATINHQMCHCDQTIMLFQKTENGVSGNLLYELGYIAAQYSFIETSTKLHIFTLDVNLGDEKLFPSDLHGIWGSYISTDGKSVDEIAAEIADEFIKNQSQIHRIDKFRVLNDHNYVDYVLNKHFDHPAMSDYDLATLLLVYIQSAYCYQNQFDIKARIDVFRAMLLQNPMHSSPELDTVTEYAQIILELYCITSPNEETGRYLEQGSFSALYSDFEDVGYDLIERKPPKNYGGSVATCLLNEAFIRENEFESWFIAQLQEHISYLILVYMFNNKFPHEEYERLTDLGITYCESAIQNLELIGATENETKYTGLLLGFAYKNKSSFLSNKGEHDKSAEFGKKSLRERKKLYAYVKDIATVNPSLKNYITLEYLMQIAEKAETAPEMERAGYLKLISDYKETQERLLKNRDHMFNLLVMQYEKLSSGQTKPEN